MVLDAIYDMGTSRTKLRVSEKTGFAPVVNTFITLVTLRTPSTTTFLDCGDNVLNASRYCGSNTFMCTISPLIGTLTILPFVKSGLLMAASNSSENLLIMSSISSALFVISSILLGFPTISIMPSKASGLSLILRYKDCMTSVLLAVFTYLSTFSIVDSIGL